MRLQIRNLMFCVVGAVSVLACSSEQTPKDGLSLAVAEPEEVAGTYTQDGVTVAFEARVAGDAQSLIVTSKGEELVYMQADGTSTVIRYLGVDVSDTERPGMAQDLISWFARPEAAALAHVHELLNDTALMDLAAGELVFKISSATDRMVGHYMTHGADPDAWTNQADPAPPTNAPNPCGPCFGKCGPGCFAVGSAAYCKAHDCCCRCQGKLKCATTCLVNPNGGCCGAYRRCY